MAQLSGKQCKTARLLLKWNVRELAFRSTVKFRAIDLFEKGTKQISFSERELLGKTLRNEGIEFLDFGEIRLAGGDDAPSSSGNSHSSGSNTIYYVSEDELLNASHAHPATEDSESFEKSVLRPPSLAGS